MEGRRSIFQRAKDLYNSDKFKKVYITPDLTRNQQKIDKELRDKVHEFRKAGETTAKILAGRVVKNLEGGKEVVLYEPPKK